MKIGKNACLPIVASIICIFVMTACEGSTNSVSLRGYKHMKVLAINKFYCQRGKWGLMWIRNPVAEKLVAL
jgi:hypothetical protein